ncbi:hypothetical protein B7494_g1933 [Chlorociboria aeruginascens]|nr:hypothetical protein B7494_g1933 [Chlorociboria aeruginascens]
MGKNKRGKINAGSKKKHPPKASRPIGIKKSQPKNTSVTQAHPKKKIHSPNSRPTIPFAPSDHILLIGEGDLSFSRSLIEHHACGNMTATVLETKEELVGKYPHAEANIDAIEEGGGSVRYGVDVVKLGRGKVKEGLGGMDRVIFNFPHVGGKTTDVNRQVRYNQELLVSFFKNILPSLSSNRGSSIIVTLFEGEPYTLWNIRDLARHSGLEVERSFKFQSKAYPGYKHARTLGVVRRKNGEVGGWKGEERAARSFVFVRKGESSELQLTKKKNSDDSSEDESDEHMDENGEDGDHDGHEEHDEIDDEGDDED